MAGTMTPLTDDAIHQFWRWLADNQDRIQGYLDSNDSIKVAAAFCRSVDLILGAEWPWEVGPSYTPGYTWFFAISPDKPRGKPRPIEVHEACGGIGTRL